MTAGKLNLQKASGGITAITGVDGASNTNLVLPESGTVATTASVKAEISTGNTLVTSPTGAIGYGTGAGGTVTQLTSKSTAVTLNKPSGTITTTADALAAGASVSFTVFNSLFTANDVVIVTARNLPYASNNYRIEGLNSGAGGFGIRITNVSPVSRSEALVVNFTIIKGADA